MKEKSITDQERSVFMKPRVTPIFPFIPGLSLAVFVAIFSKILANFLPQLGAATLAILLGIFLGNTVFKQPLLAPGTKLAESKLLEISVVLLGTSVTVQTIAQLGGKGLLFVMIQLSLTLLVAYQLGKKLGFNQRMRMLMAGGNAVCGSSAIASIAPEIGAKEEEKGQIITLVNLLGTVMMLSLPLVATQVFQQALLPSAALLGGTLQSVGQVVAGASLIDSQVVQYAMLFKIIRILFLVLVVLLFGKLSGDSPTVVPTKKKIPIPWYVLGFLLFCIINSLWQLPSVVTTSSHWLSSWFEITALAAIGLRLDFSKFLREGPRFLLYGLGVGFFQTVCAVLLIQFLHI